MRAVESYRGAPRCSCTTREADSLGLTYTEARSKPPKGASMSEYTVVKVADVADQAENLGHDPEQFEIRFMRNDLGCEHCGVSFARYSKGFAAAGHTHNAQEEIYMLVSGRAQALVSVTTRSSTSSPGPHFASRRRRPARSASSETRTPSSSRSAPRTQARATAAVCLTPSPGRTPRPEGAPAGRGSAAA